MELDEHDVSTSTVDPAIAEAVNEILRLKTRRSGPECRAVPRVPYHKTVQVTKDNKTDLCPGKDISHVGVGFLHTRPIYGNIIIGFSMPNGDMYRFLGEVVRARQVGRFYEIGSKFIERIV